MKWSAWRLSAGLAWSSWFYRILAGLTLFFVLVASALFLFSVIPLGYDHKTLVFHYNVYIGIDDLRTWTWMFIFPLIWFLLTMIDLVLAFGMYRRDAYAAASFLILGFASCFPWIMLLSYLTFMNQ